MLGAMSPIWQKSAQVFHERAMEYDGWFDDSLVFDIELGALQDLQTTLVAPRLEVGVGPGRFAEELGVMLGVDPAFGALSIASKRVPSLCQGVGESLPVQSDSMATAFLLFTLCFTQRPDVVIAELTRVVKCGGHVVLGVVPKDSPWGKSLQKKRQEGHPFYQHSNFYDCEQIIGWFEDAGLVVVEERSSLFQLPGEVTKMEQSQCGMDEHAGFMVLVGQKK